MSDLRKLIEAVDDGRLSGSTPRMPPSLYGYWGQMIAAQDGSLDAAKALHEALLPGWRVGNISQSYSAEDETESDWTVWLTAPDYLTSCKQANGRSSNPARAWLLAILRAKEAEDGE